MIPDGQFVSLSCLNNAVDKRDGILTGMNRKVPRGLVTNKEAGKHICRILIPRNQHNNGKNSCSNAWMNFISVPCLCKRCSRVGGVSVNIWWLTRNAGHLLWTFKGSQCICVKIFNPSDRISNNREKAIGMKSGLSCNILDTTMLLAVAWTDPGLLSASSSVYLLLWARGEADGMSSLTTRFVACSDTLISIWEI